MPPHATVVAYFANDPTRTYQLAQWLPVLEILHQHDPVAIVVREQDSADVIAARTTLPVLLAGTLQELSALYDELDPKVALYCNNSERNFQSLISTRMLHVHINHGESDKQSMASNNAKSYDRVFVAGEASVQRLVAGLLEFDTTRLVRIGRPQLDLRPTPVLGPTSRRTVLYAPTWEGDAEYNDYTSVDSIGLDVVRAIVAAPDVRLVYKPHPKIATSRTPRIQDAHRAIVSFVDAVGAPHVSMAQGDILAVMPDCDAIVTDVSSVGPDWLYLRTEKPMFITDPYGDADRLRREIPLSRCADVIDTVDVPALAGLIGARLDVDEHHLARVGMRHFYFDDHQVGASTVRFIEEVSSLIALRDRLLGAAGESDVITA